MFSLLQYYQHHFPNNATLRLSEQAKISISRKFAYQTETLTNRIQCAFGEFTKHVDSHLDPKNEQ